MKKNFLSILTVSLLSLSLSTLYGSESVSASTGDQSSKIKITTTIFPVYDWTMNILGDKAKNSEVTMLLDNGIDLHSYTPTADDIVEIGNSDVFIYIGGHSDAWVEDVIKSSANKDLVAINLVELMGDEIKREKVVEGMDAHNHSDHKHEHDADCDGKDCDHESHKHDYADGNHDSHEHESEGFAHNTHKHEHDGHDHEAYKKEDYDPDAHKHEHDDHAHDAHKHAHDDCNKDDHSDCDHAHDHAHAHTDEHVWLSLKSAEILVNKIAKALYEVDNNEDYLINATEYAQKIATLDASYQEAIEDLPIKTLLFGDRFPFRYLADDYGLDYYAAFTGCSAETEASFETIVFLSKKVDELDLNYVMKTQNASHKIAETVVNSVNKKGVKVLVLNSLESNTNKDLEIGVSYLSVMEENLKVLKEALK